ncbi:hypothetical protein MESS2_800025 [Mesorhizobium metallidurans STM 2683]|uniref:Uncharacterized protein n=1 Tax=Mesorhizobium metallidurans STM 2683 TaxID=1297569 RepID=M5EXV3_9HYPH|nr:hypothetical protein MESS2_800025 [Mesorhizobium metallidurans STM 2683]
MRAASGMPRAASGMPRAASCMPFAMGSPPSRISSRAFIVVSPGGSQTRLQAELVPSGALPKFRSFDVTANLAKERARERRFDRRALLQRTRRSPIRPRSSRVDASARTVSPAKPV